MTLKKGNIPWNKGRKGMQIAWNKGLTKENDERVAKYAETLSKTKKGQPSKLKGRHLTEEHKQKLRQPRPSMSGGKNPTKRHEVKQKISDALKGREFSEEWKQNLSDNHADFSDENHPNWNGGRAAAEERRRGFGFIPLNEKFKDSEGHHLNKELVLYIPKELHMSIWHSVTKNINMEEINNLACEYVYGIKTEGVI